MDLEDNYRKKLLRFRDSAKEQTERERRANKEFANIGNYIKAIMGDVWPSNRPNHRSRFVDNHMSRARIETLAQYTDTRPTMTVQASSKDISQQAEILTKMCVHTWINENLSGRLVEAIDHALLSHAFWKIDAVRGRVSVSALGMDSVTTIHCTGDIQKSSLVRYSVYKPLQYFQSKWGRAVAEEIYRGTHKYAAAERSNSNIGPSSKFGDYSWARLSPAMQHNHRELNPSYTTTGMNEAFGVSQLEELWFEDVSINETRETWLVRNPGLSLDDHNYWYEVKPGQRLFPRKRLIVHGGSKPLYDSTSPYWLTGYPFALLTLNPVVWAGGGISKYRPVLPLNYGINEISAGFFDTVKKAINQVYIAKRGSVNPADWARFKPEIPGEKLMVNNTGQVGDIRALEPPQLPQYAFEFAKYLISMFDRHNGSMDAMGLSKKKQVPGGDAMEQIRDMQSAPIRLEGRAIELFLTNAGSVAVSHFLQHFTRKERYWILGPDAITWADYEWDPDTMIPAAYGEREAHHQRYRVITLPGSLHGAQKDRDQVKAATLFKMGALSVRTLLEKFDMVNPEKEMGLIKEERAGNITPIGAGGRTPRVRQAQKSGRGA